MSQAKSLIYDIKCSQTVRHQDGDSSRLKSKTKRPDYTENYSC